MEESFLFQIDVSILSSEVLSKVLPLQKRDCTKDLSSWTLPYVMTAGGFLVKCDIFCQSFFLSGVICPLEFYPTRFDLNRIW